MEIFARNALLLLFIAVFVSVVKISVERYVDLTEAKYFHKTKSFDAERQMPSHLAWIAQPAKSFDAETEALRQNANGFIAKTIKFY